MTAISSSDWDALLGGILGLCLRRCLVHLFLDLVGARLAVEKAALLDRAASLRRVGDGGAELVTREGALGLDRRGEMRNVFGDGVLRTHGSGIDAVGLASLGECVVARVEVFTLLEVLGEVVGF